MVRINSSELMTTPLPVRCDPRMGAVNASSGTSARSFTTDRLISSKSSPGIAAPDLCQHRASSKRVPILCQVPLLERHHSALMFRVAAWLITLGQDTGLIVLGDYLVLLRGLVPAPNHPLDVDLRSLAVDQPVQIHIRVHGAPWREQKQYGEIVGGDELGEGAERQVHAPLVEPQAFAHQRGGRLAVLGLRFVALADRSLQQQAQMGGLRTIVDRAYGPSPARRAGLPSFDGRQVLLDGIGGTRARSRPRSAHG